MQKKFRTIGKRRRRRSGRRRRKKKSFIHSNYVCTQRGTISSHTLDKLQHFCTWIKNKKKYHEVGGLFNIRKANDGKICSKYNSKKV